MSAVFAMFMAIVVGSSTLLLVAFTAMFVYKELDKVFKQWEL